MRKAIFLAAAAILFAWLALPAPEDNNVFIRNCAAHGGKVRIEIGLRECAGAKTVSNGGK
jgi:hypothetical protein